MKTIDTLVEDIQALITDGKILDDDRASRFGQAISSTVVQRFNETSGNPSLRFSNLGTPCERKLWYSINQHERGIPLSASARFKFLFGDILEHMLLFLAEEAGHLVTHRQYEVEVNGVKGHIDGIIDGVLVDTKSASSFSFKKFSKGELEANDPFGYITQLNGYHSACLSDPNLDIDPTKFAFLVIDKQLGHTCLDVHKPKEIDLGLLIEQKKDMVSSSIPNRAFFDVPDGKSGNRKLDTMCGYCGHKFSCWPNLRTFLYSNGPRYLTNVERLPDVPEVIGEQESGNLDED